MVLVFIFGTQYAAFKVNHKTYKFHHCFFFYKNFLLKTKSRYFVPFCGAFSTHIATDIHKEYQNKVITRLNCLNPTVNIQVVCCLLFFVCCVMTSSLRGFRFQSLIVMLSQKKESKDTNNPTTKKQFIKTSQNVIKLFFFTIPIFKNKKTLLKITYVIINKQLPVV